MYPTMLITAKDRAVSAAVKPPLGVGRQALESEVKHFNLLYQHEVVVVLTRSRRGDVMRLDTPVREESGRFPYRSHLEHLAMLAVERNLP